MTLRGRLTAAFVLVVVLPLVVGALLVARAVPGTVQSRQADSVAALARLAVEVLQDQCDRVQATAETAGRASAGTSVGPARLAVASLVERGLADGVRVLDATGRVVAASGTLPGAPTDCRGSGQQSQEPYLSAVVDLSTADGRAAGTAVASLSLTGGLLPRLQSAIGTGDVLLVDADGAFTGLTDADLATARAVVGGATRTGEQVGAFVPSAAAGTSFGVVVLQPAAQGPGLLAGTGAVLLVAVLLAVVIAVVSARATTGPLEELGVAAARIAGGDLSTVIDVRGRDEVSRLARAFNAMTEDLRDHVGQLEASRDELQAGLSRLGETLSSTHDLDGILHVVLEAAMAGTRAVGGMVLLLTPGREELVLSVQRGLDVPVDLRIASGEGVSGRVAVHGEPLRGRVEDGAAGEPPGVGVIAVPLKSGGSVIGVLDLFAAPGDDFDDNELATIRTFASQATVAVDNVILHEEAQRLSITDGLTGLWNYRYFSLTVGKEIERAARFARPMALLMLDLDHFKAVNDTFGHQRGDEVLVELAARLKLEVRDVDTVARYGGEEFVVLLPETDTSGAAQLAERICDTVRRRPFTSAGEPPVHLTVSVGGAVFPEHGLAATVLLSRADEALYVVKHEGRNGWRLSAGVQAPATRSEQASTD